MLIKSKISQMSPSFLLLVVCCSTVQKVHSWGAVGHSLVARLAQSQLTDQAPDWVRFLVPRNLSGNLSAIASWADTILYADTNPVGYGNWQWSRPLHYINVPDWNCNYDPERDCKNDDCIEGALRNYSRRAVAADLDDVQHQEALMFLVHYVGDVHQPLHAGFAGDLGGNRVRGHFMNGTYLTNLHSLWDSGILSVRVARDFESNITRYYDHIHSLMLNQKATTNDEDFKQWIAESVKFVCQQIYLDEENTIINSSSNFKLGDIYYNRNFPVIDQRLANAGRRLGFLLSRLALAADRRVPPSKKLGSGTIALIVILCIGFFVVIVGIGVFMFIRHHKRNT